MQSNNISVSGEPKFNYSSILNPPQGGENSAIFEQDVLTASNQEEGMPPKFFTLAKSQATDTISADNSAKGDPALAISQGMEKIGSDLLTKPLEKFAAQEPSGNNSSYKSKFEDEGKYVAHVLNDVKTDFLSQSFALPEKDGVAKTLSTISLIGLLQIKPNDNSWMYPFIGSSILDQVKEKTENPEAVKFIDGVEKACSNNAIVPLKYGIALKSLQILSKANFDLTDAFIEMGNFVNGVEDKCSMPSNYSGWKEMRGVFNDGLNSNKSDKFENYTKQLEAQNKTNNSDPFSMLKKENTESLKQKFSKLNNLREKDSDGYWGVSSKIDDIVSNMIYSSNY